MSADSSNNINNQLFSQPILVAKEEKNSLVSTGDSLTGEKSSNSDNANSIWKFGISKFRIENGEVRSATQAEIEAETRSSPQVLVSILGTGADLLRFDANGEYKDDAERIAALYKGEGSPEEIAAAVRDAVQQLREKMREDIRSGVFTVDDAGQVFHRGQPIPPESVGFELNGLLIESLTNKVGELTALGGQIVEVDKFVQAQLNEVDEFKKNNKVTILYDRRERHRVEDRTEGAGGKGLAPDPNFAQRTSTSKNHPANNFKTVADESPFDKFIEEGGAFSEILAGIPTAQAGDVLMSRLQNDYDRLLEGSGLPISNFLKDEPNGKEQPNGPSVRHGTPPIEDLEKQSRVGADRVFRAVPLFQEFNRKSIGATELSNAKANIDARVSTLSSLSEQLGTNFKVDNARFNSIIEAMNSYNKSVVDSLRRFSVI